KKSLPLAIPPNAPVRLSSLVLAGSWEEAGKQTRYRVKRGKQISVLENPLQVGEGSLIPRIGASFFASETVYIHGKVNVQDQMAKPEYRIALYSEDGETLFEGAWKELVSGSGRLYEISARLPLNQLAPGRYRVSAELRTGDRETFELGRDFTVVSGVDSESG
ncbi:MAG: hypothetical protein ACWGQW_19940, partial [bacterium]